MRRDQQQKKYKIYRWQSGVLYCTCTVCECCGQKRPIKTRPVRLVQRFSLVGISERLLLVLPLKTARVAKRTKSLTISKNIIRYALDLLRFELKWIEISRVMQVNATQRQQVVNIIHLKNYKSTLNCNWQTRPSNICRIPLRNFFSEQPPETMWAEHNVNWINKFIKR